jgi:putative transposase
MARANRYMVPGAAYHLTHRCHDRAFLLKFATDRNRYRAILREELSSRGVSLLSYCVTSNHVHLLVADGTRDDVARLMQAVQGRFAEEYNRRRSRRGAFWSDRYHATMIGGREHLWACMRYIDLNMVRAGAVVHPRDWEWTAWHELAGDRKRYRLVDQDALLDRFEGVQWPALRRQYAASIDEAVSQHAALRREALWTEAVAVGNREFVAGIETELEQVERRNRMSCSKQSDDTWILREPSATLGLYSIKGSKNRV